MLGFIISAAVAAAGGHMTIDGVCYSCCHKKIIHEMSVLAGLP